MKTSERDKENTAYKLELKFFEDLFEFFKRHLPIEVFVFDSTIPFHTFKIIFHDNKYSDYQMRVVLNKWQDMGLILPVRFRGFRLVNPNANEVEIISSLNSQNSSHLQKVAIGDEND